MEILGTLITVLLIVVGMVVRNNICLTVIDMLWIWIIMAFNYDGVDYNGNEIIYQISGYNEIENISSAIHYLPNMLIGIAHELSLDYWEYNGIIVSLLLLLFFAMIIKNVRNHTTYMSLFMIYPLMDSVFQKRFFIAMIICVFALWYASNKKIIKYVVLTFVSMGFHFTAVFSFLYVFISWVRKKSLSVMILMFILEITLLVLFRDYLVMVVAVDNAKVTEYIGGNAISFLAGTLFILTQIWFVLMTDLILRSYQDDERVKFIRSINTSSIFFAPFLLLDAVFFRFYRIVMILSYMYIVDALCRKYIDNNRQYRIAVIYIVILVAWVYFTANFDKIGWQFFLETLFRYNKVIELWM